MLRSLFLIIFLTLLPGNSFADQADPRLPDLFDELKSAADAGEAAVVEQQIWEIWHTAPNEELQQLMRQGMDAMNNSDLAQARSVFDEMIKLAPDYAEGWNKRATVHYLMQNLPASLADIAETLKREPRHFGAIAGRGLVHIRGNQLAKAAEAFEDVLTISPQNPGSQSNLDAIREALGQKDI
ncbi:tetratricopeptide repeat protein [Pararhizobium sp. IMCC21322]|uniref:tetratricopeptide repeat protein n=1 Tax=Pararhizobium sp. IMCC21322 TaxID=3067903 RepID=UPI0027403627|nr:tetratricopeptide repeat protein [Pararhizobium sp. IMCC21322]